MFLVCSSMRKAPIFKEVLKFTNKYLEDNFGSKLEPMPFVTAAITAAAKTNQSRKAAVNQLNKVTSSKSAPPQHYMLVSTLKVEERAKIPRSTRDAVRLGIIQAILLIIKLSGNSIEHKQLVAALNELQLCRNNSEELAQGDLESFLEQMKREKYILKEKKNLVEVESVYSWGPRAYVEFPSNNMAAFLYKVNKYFKIIYFISHFRLQQLIAMKMLKQDSNKRPLELLNKPTRKAMKHNN